MDEIRKVAKAYYTGAAGSEKELARELFRSLDRNGDGKVSLREYKKMVKPCFSSDDLFNQLDANCDGTLDFDEVLALNYMDKVSVPRCNACSIVLLHSYFSCLPCQADASYYLCCNCYAAGGDQISHRHSSNNFVDTRAMLKLLDQLLKQAQITTCDDHHLQGDVGEVADVLTLGLALEEDDSTEEEDEDEEEEDEDGDVEEVVDVVDKCEDYDEDKIFVDREKCEDEEEEEEEKEVDKCEVLNQNIVSYGKAVYKSQPESKKYSNGSIKKTKTKDKAGNESKLQSGSKRELQNLRTGPNYINVEKVLGAIEAVNNKVDSYKEKKKKMLANIEAVNNKAGEKKEKVLGSIHAVNDKVKAKKKKVKQVISIGAAVVHVGANAAASTLYHHVVRHRKS